MGKTYFSTKKKQEENIKNSFLYYVHVSVKIISTELKIKIKIVKNKKSLKYHSSVKTGDLIEYKVIWFASVGGKMQ